MNLFGGNRSSGSSSSSSSKSGGTKDQVREWTSQLKQEQRLLQRDLVALQREEIKHKAELKRIVKTPNGGNSAAVRIIAKSIASGRKVQDKLLTASTQINSVILNLKMTSASVSVVGHLSKSTAIMASMNQLLKLDKISETTRNMSKEMTKMGIMDEMISVSLSVTDSDDLEEAADEEVEKVMFEVTEGMIGKAPTAKTRISTPETDTDDQKKVEISSRMHKLGA